VNKSRVSRDQLGFTIESSNSSSSQSDDLKPIFDVRREEVNICSNSEDESCSQNFNCWTDSFIVLMSDSFEVISLPADMMQVFQIFI